VGISNVSETDKKFWDEKRKEDAYMFGKAVKGVKGRI